MDHWQMYIKYLKDWADTHSDITFKGMSPASYPEWLDNEDSMECPYNGDASDDCEGCVYSKDYHRVNGECVLRKPEDPALSCFESPKEVHR